MIDLEAIKGRRARNDLGDIWDDLDALVAEVEQLRKEASRSVQDRIMDSLRRAESESEWVID